ncbi:MAG: chemotaxis protein CheB [Holophagae bacterium]|jgi:two-component system chemotaxis response regulator CheB
MIRVAVADGSVAVRAVLKRCFEARTNLQIAGEAENGSSTIELACEARLDALVLDLDLPESADLIPSIARRSPVPVFLIAGRTQRQELLEVFGAGHHGVVAVYQRPELPEQWESLCSSLADAISAMEIGVDHHLEWDHPGQTVVAGDISRVGIGASTGGPNAVAELLAGLGKRPKVGVVVVQHISPGFETVLAEWLNDTLPLDIRVASDGEPLLAGSVRIAPAGSHCELGPDGVIHLVETRAPVNGHQPSVETLFRSLLHHPSSDVAAVLLSGMGSDGAEAMLALRQQEVLTIAQDRRSCAVFGMPRAAIEKRAASVVLTPGAIGRLLAGRDPSVDD